MKRVVEQIFHSIPHALFSHGNVSAFSRFIRHLIVGGAGTLLYIACIAFLVEFLDFHPVTSVVLAFSLVVAYTYSANRSWVYQSKLSHRYSLLRFLVVISISFLLNTGIMYGAVEVVGLWYGWGLVATALIIPISNFYLNLLWAFK
jgi:putative flippase GtrA